MTWAELRQLIADLETRHGLCFDGYEICATVIHGGSGVAAVGMCDTATVNVGAALIDLREDGAA